MKKIKFDIYGNPTPYEFIFLSLEELEYNFLSQFDTSCTRKNILAGYKAYCNDLLCLVKSNVEQWIGGSFTTTKINPNDIDISTIIDVDLIENPSIATAIKKFTTKGESKNTYLVDGYIIPKCAKGSPYYDYCMDVYNYWSSFWRRNRQDMPRGIIVRNIVYETN